MNDDNIINVLLVNVSIIIINDNLSWINRLDISMFMFINFRVVVFIKSVRDKSKIVNLFQKNIKIIIGNNNFNIYC